MSPQVITFYMASCFALDGKAALVQFEVSAEVEHICCKCGEFFTIDWTKTPQFSPPPPPHPPPDPVKQGPFAERPSILGFDFITSGPVFWTNKPCHRCGITPQLYSTLDWEIIVECSPVGKVLNVTHATCPKCLAEMKKQKNPELLEDANGD